MKNYNISVICIILSVFVLVAHSKPLLPEEIEDPEYKLDHVGRVKRVTCDVLSLNINILGSGGQLNHSACALHCIYLGKAGGHCDEDGICECRK